MTILDTRDAALMELRFISFFISQIVSFTSTTRVYIRSQEREREKERYRKRKGRHNKRTMRITERIITEDDLCVPVNRISNKLILVINT